MIQLLILISVFNCFTSTPIPKSLDWRTKGAVLPVPNQGQCGSASIFTALDSISAQQKIKHGGQLVQLSKQQVYDCSGTLCPCAGDLGVTQIYDLIWSEKQDNHIDSEESYPYTGQCDKICKFKKSGSVTTLRAYASASGNKSYENLLEGYLQQGPVAITIQANTDSFQLYTNGIFNDPNCKGEELDHSLLLVGYGTENGVDYWIARNSWGTSWGEKGYIRIIRDKNMCGIGNYFAQPFVD